MRSLKYLAAAAAALTLASGAIAQPVFDAAASAERIKAHVGFLASDLMEGREAGSRGYDIAANYVASQFAQLGLKPAGDEGTYFQETPLLAFRAADEGRYVLHAKDRTVPLVFGEDVMPGRNPHTRPIELKAPLVFVGYGIHAPEHRRDDYRGLNVRGKIVVVLAGAPSFLQSEERAYYGNARTKRVLAQAHGAVGVITLDKPDDEKRRPFAAGKRTWKSWSMTWRKPDGTPFDVAPKTAALGSISAGGASKLFESAKVSWEQVIAAAMQPKGDPPRFVLPVSLEVAIRGETEALQSRNVAGLIEGSDPKLKDEVIVLSAHLDHVGITPPVNGDAINNGALDNATGIATTLEAARAFQGARPPKRSILFLALTAEEKGLVGAEYFARNPTMPRSHLVANVNLDMPVLLYDFVDVVAFGSERSNIGPAVQRAAARMNVALSGDPLPEEGLFTRSDHYRFVEVGVPSVFLMTGFQNGGEAKFKGFLAGCYHNPCDDLSQPIDYRAGARFAQLNYEIARELADGEARPQWNAGDFFGRKFGTVK